MLPISFLKERVFLKLQQRHRIQLENRFPCPAGSFLSYELLLNGHGAPGPVSPNVR